jgi:hypothetical protein
LPTFWHVASPLYLWRGCRHDAQKIAIAALLQRLDRAILSSVAGSKVIARGLRNSTLAHLPDDHLSLT